MQLVQSPSSKFTSQLGLYKAKNIINQSKEFHRLQTFKKAVQIVRNNTILKYELFLAKIRNCSGEYS